MQRAFLLSVALLILIAENLGCSNNATNTPVVFPTPQYNTARPDPESTLASTQSAVEQSRVASLARLTDTIGRILSQPESYVGKQVEVIGYFRGWDLLKEVKGTSPVTRSDWVIADSSGAIYVTGILPPNLDPASLQDAEKLVHLVATVGQNQNGVFLQAESVEVISTD